MKLPPIPDGFKHLTGNVNTGLVVRRESDGTELVWIPAFVEPNGTLDGKKFDQYFGRRDWIPYTPKKGEEKLGNRYSLSMFIEDCPEDVEAQLESIKKHGGFWISRYLISIDPVTNNPRAIPGVMPANACPRQAFALAEDFAEGIPGVKTYIPSGAAYDTMLVWLLNNGFISEKRITSITYSKADATTRIMPTGCLDAECYGNIFDLVGNGIELTSEMKDGYYIKRGGFTLVTGDGRTVRYCRPLGDRNRHNAMPYNVFRIMMTLD